MLRVCGNHPHSTFSRAKSCRPSTVQLAPPRTPHRRLPTEGCSPGFREASFTWPIGPKRVALPAFTRATTDSSLGRGLRTAGSGGQNRKREHRSRHRATRAHRQVLQRSAGKARLGLSLSGSILELRHLGNVVAGPPYIRSNSASDGYSQFQMIRVPVQTGSSIQVVQLASVPAEDQPPGLVSQRVQALTELLHRFLVTLEVGVVGTPVQSLCAHHLGHGGKHLLISLAGYPALALAVLAGKHLQTKVIVAGRERRLRRSISVPGSSSSIMSLVVFSQCA